MKGSIKRGRIVLGSYSMKKRQLETHFYFPYTEKIKKTRTIKTTKYQPEIRRRLATTTKAGTYANGKPRLRINITSKVKENLPPKVKLEDWWKNTKSVIFHGQRVKLKPSEYRDNTLRFTIPRKIIERDNIQPGEKVYVNILELKPITQETTEEYYEPMDLEALIKNAKIVLIEWLRNISYGPDDVPCLSEWKENLDKAGANKIGIALEDEVNTLSPTTFALRIFDYDFQRKPGKSTFDYEPDWHLTPNGVQTVISLAQDNTISNLRPKGRKQGRKNGQTRLGGS